MGAEHSGSTAALYTGDAAINASNSQQAPFPGLPEVQKERFSWLLANGVSAIESYCDAFPDVSHHPKTAYSQACRLRAEMGPRIAHHRARVKAAFASTGDESIAGDVELAQFHSRVIRAPLALTELESDLIQEITTTTRTDASGAETVKQVVKLPAKMTAAQELAKLAGLYASEKVELGGIVEFTSIFSKARQSNGIILDEMGECIIDYSALLD